MTGSKTGPWIAGTVIVSVLLMIASWFLAISPVMASTAAANEQVQAQRDQNVMLQAKLKTLKEQSLKLDEYKATLAGLQLQIPPTGALPEYQRQLAAIAALNSVTIVSINVAPANPIVAAAPAAPATAEVTDPAAAPADGAAPTDGSAPTDGTAPVEPASANIDGFYELGVSMELLGTYPNVKAFLDAVQNNPGRILFVSALSGSSPEEAEEGGGRPATHVGDLQLSVTGSLFVLTDGAVPVPPVVDPNVAPPALPVPPADKNPLVPIGQ